MVAGLVLQCVNVMLDIVQYLLVGDRFAKVNLFLSFSVKSRNNFPILQVFLQPHVLKEALVLFAILLH